MDSDISKHWRVPEGPDLRLAQRPKIHSAARLGGFSERTTAGRCNRLRGGTSDASNANRAQRRAEEQRQAVPPCARDLRLEFEEAGLPMFNSPQDNLGAAMARLQQANPSP
jgi:hypothetical protein